MKHFTRTEDFTKEQYEEIFRRSEIFEKGLKNGKTFTHLCSGKVIATEFFQESTRTSASFKAAMTKLGGGWFGFDGIKGTYLELGEEDLEDTLRGVEPLCDIMAIRHKNFNLTEFVQNRGFRVPMINAMCGTEEHSIAGLAFVYVIKKHLKDLKGKKFGIYGMSKSSRPMKASAKVLGRYGVEFYEDPVIHEFQLPQYIRDTFTEGGSSYKEDKMENWISEVDHIFVVEGLPQPDEDAVLVDNFNKAFVPFSNAHLAKVKATATVGVSEPRATLDGRLVALKETDNDPRMAMAEMIESIIYCNMALITYLLEVEVK